METVLRPDIYSIKDRPASLLSPIPPPLLPLSSSLFFFFPFFPALSLIHCQEGPCQKGPFSVSWQQQRLAAPTASTVSLGFVSGARGWTKLSNTDSLRALERNLHVWEADANIVLTVFPNGAII